MKQIILFAAAAILFVSCNTAEKGYTIKGTVTGENEALKSGKAYLSNRDNTEPIKDTADMVNGKFVFKGEVTTPEDYLITIEGLKGRIPIFLENESYTISAADTLIAEAVITGGFTQNLNTQLSEKWKELQEKYNLEALMQEYRQASDEKKKEIEEIYEKYSAEAGEYQKKLLSDNPLTHFSLSNFRQEVDDMDVDSAEALFNQYKAKAEFAGNRILASIEKTIELNKKIQVGQPSQDFTMKDPDGKSITFSDIYKANKVTMIDFWAGWCSPCRQFNPTLVKIYAEYHKKGFEVLGVSFDRDRATWLDAIKADKLVWPQVSDVNFWECEPRHLYNIHYIPQNVFVDRNGIIIGRRVAEDEIIPFLEEHLKL